MQEKGTISIHTENIFPIIKKFLYSDHEIFLRELVSNAVDACQKLGKLGSLGEYSGEVGDLKVRITADKEAKTLTISDSGIGMTADEIKKYINQIAFSGAVEFVEKYKDKTDARDQIIGQFGLGFYSAFMVASLVEIQTLSYQEGAQPARWTCDGSTEFSIEPGTRTERGTDIILHLAEDSLEFLDTWKLRELLGKYGKFLPIAVEFEGEVINNTQPLWTKSPSELSDEDYLAFYKELYPASAEPLFWIHLNVDYPFNLTGILYFPRLKKDVEVQRDKIQLYSRQVFITDEVKDVVPEFLMLLHGVIDSPDIPLNVSRSFLQADGNVKKINSHITKKVADKLGELFTNDRAAYEEKWEHIGLFVKYGMISEPKFNDRAKDFALLKNTEGKHYTFTEYREHVAPQQTNKDEQVVFLYTSDAEGQATYIQAARRRDYDVLVLDHILDTHFSGHLERSLEKVQVRRVDADSIDQLIAKDHVQESVLTEAQVATVKTTFQESLSLGENQVKVESLSPQDLPVSLTQDEFARRMKEMYAGQGMGDLFGASSYTVVVNGNHPYIQRILSAEGDERSQLTRQAYDLALLSQKELKGEALSAFIERTLGYMGK